MKAKKKVFIIPINPFSEPFAVVTQIGHLEFIRIGQNIYKFYIN